MPKLTKTAVDNMKPAAGDTCLWDSDVPGFGVRCQPSGRKTYIVRYRNADHVQRKMTLGRCTDLTTEQARQLARKAFGTVADGTDPTEARRERRDAPTMRELSEKYLKEHAEPYKKPSSVRTDRGLWKNVILPKWGSRRVQSITSEEIVALHGSLFATPVKANHTLALLSKAMNLAEQWKWRTGGNPCRQLKKFKIKQRDTVLSGEQIKALHIALDAPETIPPMRDLVRLLLMTGCRLNEIMSAERSWVDTDRHLLVLPDSKVGQRKIVLPSAALAIIAAGTDSRWIIPGRLAGEHMKSPHKMFNEIARRAGLPVGTRPHDLRHTFGSIGHRAGLSQRQIATLLGHKALITTERYLHGYSSDAGSNVEMVAGLLSPG